MKTLLAAFILIAVLGLGGAVFFFTQRQSLTVENTALQGKLESAEKTVAGLKDEKTKVETELAVLKSTDLGKEVELLQLKLKNAERDFAAAEKDTTGLKNEVNNLEANLGKITPYLDVTSAIEQSLSAPFTASSLANIDTKVSALQDSQITSLWLKGKGTVDIWRQSWMPSDVFPVIFLINAKIRDLLL